jgi:hypothetical protein
VVRVRQQHLAYAGECAPGAGGRERDARSQIEQQHAVDEQRGRGPRRRPERGLAGGARTVGAGQSARGSGAEQCQFHRNDPPASSQVTRARIVFDQERAGQCKERPGQRRDRRRDTGGDMAWTWRFEKADGTEIAPAVEPEDFSTQGDAESWIGEVWKELLDGGAEQVRLFEDDTEIYAMSLKAAAE